MQKTIDQLQIHVDDETGQLVRLVDTELNREIISFKPGHEFELNQRPLKAKAVEHAVNWGRLRSEFDAEDQPMYKAGRRLRLTRDIVPGGSKSRIGRRQSLSLRYRVRRVPWGDWENELDQIWGPPIEAPLLLETMSLLTAPTDFFGPGTRMRALAIGGSGPRDHVSYEDGPVAEVVPWLKTGFRNSFPGQQTIPGAMYYDPKDERWLWIICRHPHVGGQIEYAEDRQTYRFGFFTDLELNRELVSPDITIQYGQGLEEAEKTFAEQFDLFEEPPDWFFHTSWFWLHNMWQANATFAETERAVKILMDECGVNGFGLVSHDLPLAGADVEPRSYKASPYMGSDEGLRRVADLINDKGGHSYIWYTRSAAAPETAGNGGFRDAWALKGTDGRPVYVDAMSSQMCNSLHPGYQDYVLEGIEYYVSELGITGVFWDSGFQPLTPDFSDPDHVYMDCPNEAMAGMGVLYDRAYRFGRSLSPDFFMWTEGISTECRANGFAVDNRTHGPNSGHLLMHRIAHAGPRRLVWRSAWNRDVSGAFPFLAPQNDVSGNTTLDTYRRIAADPMNQWLCRTVWERGCRQAVGVADGMALLDEFLLVGHKAEGEVVLRASDCPKTSLKHVITGETVKGTVEGENVRFKLNTDGAYERS
ncbi:MAG: hypothetical protein R6V03_02125 [Kiritimatiellia bacterium]